MVPDLPLLREWIETPSITGEEGDYGDRVARELVRRGFAVERQPLGPGRFNVLARAGTPEVVFCTHLDTVPPWFGWSEDGEYVHGRGACDAKGVLCAMLAAASQLLKRGQDRIGFLLTAGEEIDSAGAQLANQRLADPWRPRYTIVGEPTENTFVQSHKGIFKGRLSARGVAGHSSQAVGPSAIHELVGAIQRLLDQSWGSSACFGEGSLNVGTIGGGRAPNVVADCAEASLLARIVEPPEQVEARIRSCLGPHVDLDVLAACYAPVEFCVPAGRPSIRVAFGTDAPHLPRWGKKLLYGPGRILDAHTAHERVSKQSLADAAQDYERVASNLLQEGPTR
jgi:acetylornithine deacetylase